MVFSMSCQECGAARGHLLGCSLVSSAFRPTEPTLAERVEEDDRTSREDLPSDFERYRLLAFPLVYLGLWIVSAVPAVQGLLRIFFGMWLHELGHASAAWLTGRWALPLPWFTFSFSRSWLVTALLVLAVAALVRFGLRRPSRLSLGLGVALGLATLVGHLLPTAWQEPFFTFGGEAGAMVFGALLSCGYLVRSHLRPFQGGLRFGWLVIGAASWVDATRLWWTCWKNPDEIPFGLEDGHPSDATVLVDTWNWDADAMVRRFLFVAFLSLGLALVAFAAAIVREALTRRRSA